MIVAREEEIRRFQPVPYYTLTAKLSEFQALYRNRQNQTRISDRSVAEELQKKCTLSRQAKVTSLKKEQKREAPPLLYDLTELQRDANRRFSFSAKQTLNLMQSLYETHKLLTYPRTDSRYLSSDILPTLLIRVKALTASAAYGKIAAPLQRRSFTGKQRFVNDAKVSDHHAIIPTEQPLNWNALTADEKRIYDLVVRRFLAVLSEDSVYDQTEVQLQIAGETFTAKGKISVSAGWRGIYDAQLFSSDDEDGNADEDKDQSLPPLQQGQTLPVQEVRLDQHMTKPPKRYTEATLLTAMENPGRFVQDQQLRNVLEEANGIGTPATRAEIIERLLSANYCERRGKEFYPLSKGEQLLKLAPPDLKSPILTAQWEQKLTLIAKSKLKDTLFLAEMKEYTKRLVEAVKIAQGEYHHDNMTRTRCPSCGQFLLEVNGKKGKMLVCPDRECGYRQNVSYLSNARCPTCHKKLEVVGEGEKKIYTCKCGFREKYDRFNQMLAENKQQASKSEIKRFEQEQAKRIEKESVSAFALAWQNAQKKE
jgi:DNA topoisomerase-3